MIQLNELRVGGVVYSIIDQKNAALDLDDFAVMGNYIRSNHPIPYNPIVITPEILEKAEFVKTDWYWWHKQNDFEIVVIDKDYKFSYNQNEYEIGNVFKYLHQLQNLYLDLTHTELSIKNLLP